MNKSSRRGTNVDKPKPWRMELGVLAGLLVGSFTWWSAYKPGAGWTQKLQLLLVPIALGGVIVDLRNRRKKVGAYDPETIAQNKAGRV